MFRISFSIMIICYEYELILEQKINSLNNEGYQSTKYLKFCSETLSFCTYLGKADYFYCIQTHYWHRRLDLGISCWRVFRIRSLVSQLTIIVHNTFQHNPFQWIPQISQFTNGGEQCCHAWSTVSPNCAGDFYLLPPTHVSLDHSVLLS